MAVLVPFALPGRQPSDGPPSADRIPVWSLLLLGAAALAISVAGIPRSRRRHRRPARRRRRRWSWCSWSSTDATEASVLPPTAFRPGPLKWIYLTLGLLMAATMVDMYVPLFGQRLAHLVPVAAGFLGVALAVGWTRQRDRQRVGDQRTRVIVRSGRGGARGDGASAWRSAR